MEVAPLVNDESTEVEGRESEPEFAGGDYLLGGMAFGFGAAGAEIGVTLIAGGVVVHGNLVSATRFFERIGEELGAAWSRLPGSSPDLGEYFRSQVAQVGDNVTSRAEDQGIAPEHGDFVYLDDAVLVTPVGALPVGPWRGRLAAITGWSLGRPAEHEQH